MRRGALIYNPRAGGWHTARSVEPVLEALRRSEFVIEPCPTAGPGDATRLARQAALDGAEVVFAYGGDGTLREVAAGLLGTDTALGPLGAGTTNVVTRYFGIPAEPVLAARALARLGRITEIDVGLLGTEPFLMLASAGFDADALIHVAPRLKRRLGRIAVALAVLRRIGTYRFPELRLSADGHEIGGTFAAVSNLPLYGGGWTLAPRARPDDGLLEVLVFRGRGPAATASFVFDLVLGRHTGRSDVSQITVTEACFEEPRDAAIQIDGDVYAGPRPAAVRVAPSPLRVLVPEAGPEEFDTSTP